MRSAVMVMRISSQKARRDMLRGMSWPVMPVEVSSWLLMAFCASYQPPCSCSSRIIEPIFVLGATNFPWCPSPTTPTHGGMSSLQIPWVKNRHVCCSWRRREYSRALSPSVSKTASYSSLMVDSPASFTRCRIVSQSWPVS
mgnify:CR=1 FL=1